MIIQTVCFDDFCNSFSDSHKDNFSNAGKKALFDYLENLSEDLGEDIELDTVCLCCDYTEYDNLEALQNDYQDILNMEELRDRTEVIDIEGTEGFIIANF